MPVSLESPLDARKQVKVRLDGNDFVVPFGLILDGFGCALRESPCLFLFWGSCSSNVLGCLLSGSPDVGVAPFFSDSTLATICSEIDMERSQNEQAAEDIAMADNPRWLSLMRILASNHLAWSQWQRSLHSIRLDPNVLRQHRPALFQQTMLVRVHIPA